MTQPVSFDTVRRVGDVRVERVLSGTNAVQAADTRAQPAAEHVPVSKLTEIARRLAAEGPPVDHARIAQISQAIASGAYRIDAAAIADAMLRRLSLAD